jgi:predicted nucleotidyltransferase
MKNRGRVKLTENENKALYGFKHILLKRFPQADIILYGSKARGDYDEFSDIDLLVLLDSEVDRSLREEVGEIRYEMELKYDVVFGLMIENKDFWNSPLAKAMPLHWNVDREGVMI